MFLIVDELREADDLAEVGDCGFYFCFDPIGGGSYAQDVMKQTGNLLARLRPVFIHALLQDDEEYVGFFRWENESWERAYVGGSSPARDAQLTGVYLDDIRTVFSQ